MNKKSVAIIATIVAMIGIVLFCVKASADRVDRQEVVDNYESGIADVTEQYKQDKEESEQLAALETEESEEIVESEIEVVNSEPETESEEPLPMVEVPSTDVQTSVQEDTLTWAHLCWLLASSASPYGVTAEETVMALQAYLDESYYVTAYAIAQEHDNPNLASFEDGDEIIDAGKQVLILDDNGAALGSMAYDDYVEIFGEPDESLIINTGEEDDEELFENYSYFDIDGETLGIVYELENNARMTYRLVINPWTGLVSDIQIYNKVPE